MTQTPAFKIGSIVKLKSGGPDMTVKQVLNDYRTNQPDGNYKCQWFAGKKRVGLTAGASAPESLAQAIVARIQEFGPRSVRAMSGVVEDVTFSLPKNLVD